MNRAVILVVAVFAFGRCFKADAMFAWHQTQQVPISRLFTNLQQRLAMDTNNFELTYDLARLHSMAYSTNLTSIGVKTNDDRPQFGFPGSDAGVPQAVDLPRSGPARTEVFRHLTNAILLYERAILLLKTSTNQIQYKEWLVLPLELGHAWCLDQSGDREKALTAYRRALAIAWKQEIVGDFKFKEWAEGVWNAVKSGNNPLGVKTGRGHIGPGPCYSQETIGYMLKLLDPVKDQKEIAELNRKQKTIDSMGRAITPIIIPLQEGLSLNDLVDRNATVRFDLDGSGVARSWAWVTTNAAWLVYDADGSGQITSALQMFGNVTFWIFWRDGYAALRSLDDNDDGTLRGEELRGIALWQDRNGNGVSEPGEVKPASAWGVTAISCTGETDATGTTWCPTGITFNADERRPTYDWIAPCMNQSQSLESSQ